MYKIILVIGDVTRDQYQPIRQTVLRAGFQPKVVRVTTNEFLLATEDLFEKYAPEHANDDLDDDQYISLAYRCARMHVSSYGDIVAVVMDSSSYEYWGSSASNHYVEELIAESPVTRWVIENGELRPTG